MQALYFMSTNDIFWNMIGFNIILFKKFLVLVIRKG